MSSTPISSQPPLYLANYPTTATEGAPANAQYYLNIPAGMTVQPDEPSSTGAGATAVSGMGYGHYHQLYDGSVANFGTIIGGVAAPGTGDAGGEEGGGVATGSGLTGGTGVSLAFGVAGEPITSGYNAGETTYKVVALFNEKGGTITGGAGGAGGEAAAGGQGGIGVSDTGFAGRGGGPILNKGTITGGAGGVGGQGVYAEGTGGAGGTGGTGVYLTSEDWLSGNTLYGVIRGGNGGAAPAGMADEAANTSGAGGIGLKLGNGGALSNYGHLYGGNGSDATFTIGGNGGVGADLAINSTLFNHNLLEGGNGMGTGASGGAGLRMDAAYSVVNEPGYAHNNGRFYGATEGVIQGGNGNVAGGVGVYLDGGVLHQGAIITGGMGQTDGQADAVLFGPKAGTMIINEGAVFNGAIGGFAVGDTIDFTDLSPTQVESYFKGDAITTPNDGTLNFTGNLSGERFVFSGYGDAGTQVTVEGASHIIVAPTTTPVVAGGPNYPDGIDVSASGAVTSTVYGGYAIYNSGGSNTISNEGSVTAGAGQSTAGYGGTGGAGIEVSGSATISNSGSVSGGSGGNSTGTDVHGGGGAGGAAVFGNSSSYTDLNNAAGGTIKGGAGGYSYDGATTGNGGIAVDFSGLYQIPNSGTYETHNTVYNAGYIEGGDAAAKAVGGSGIFAPGSLTLINSTTGTISGGDGNGGAGGTGIVLNSPKDNVTNNGMITGGQGALAGAAAGAGAGGAGAYMGGGNYGNGGVFTNYGTVHGGNDGNGGVGLQIGGGSFYDHGSIVGGTGGNGGAGVDLTGGAVVVDQTGTISGGSAGSSHYTGGAGVILDGGLLINDHIIAGGDTSNPIAVEFVAGAYSELAAGSGAQFHGAIAGFTTTDTIDLQQTTVSETAKYFGFSGVPADATSYTFAGSASESALATSVNGTLDLTGNFLGFNFVLTSDGSGGTEVTLEAAACYRKGTRIVSERGETAIETLRIGDLVLTLSGAMRPIRWIGQRRYSAAAAAGDWDVLPIRIRAGALGAGVPWRDLWVSPEHAMWLDGMLVPARALTNGSTIFQEESVEEITYLHIEFATHDVIYAEGALSESFVDDESREHFDNAAEYARLYPDAVRHAARFYGPRVEDGEELDRVRRSLIGPCIERDDFVAQKPVAATRELMRCEIAPAKGSLSPTL